MARQKASQKRTMAVWFVFLGFGLLSCAGFLRMGDSIFNWYWLNFAGVRPGVWYLVASGGSWGIVGLATLIWLWFSLPWCRQIGAAAALFFGLSYWIDRLLIGNPEGGLPNIIFSVLITVLGIGLSILALRPWSDIQKR